jgi:hypothetical protein
MVVAERYRAEPKPDRSKCYKHAKFLILHIVFVKSGLVHKSELSLTAEQLTELSHTTDLIVETVCDEGILMFRYKEFYNVFKSITDCVNLKNKVMAKLTPPARTVAVETAVPNPPPTAAPVAISAVSTALQTAAPATPDSPPTPHSATTSTT